MILAFTIVCLAGVIACNLGIIYYTRLAAKYRAEAERLRQQTAAMRARGHGA